MHDSRHQLYGPGISGESLLSGGRYDKEHSIEDQEMGAVMSVGLSGDDLSFSNPAIASPPQLLSNAGSMEVPTRDSSPFQRPPISATSHLLGHGKKDFASLTCIINPSVESPSPEPLVNELDGKGVSPTHKKPGARKDLTTLTSVISPSRNSKKQDTIPEEEEGSTKVKKKDGSPSTKKGRSKTMSRLSQLTSLDYIRQSFRIKKKKVSFQKTPETTPTPSKKVVSSSSTGSNGGTTIFSNSSTEVSPQRRVSIASNDMMFSPTEESFLRAEQGHPMIGMAHPDMLGMGVHGNIGYAQLSQPSYYLPHPYAYPQLSQQYHPQLSQGYMQYPSPYHHMANTEPLRGGGGRDHRYQEVVTPDLSDITTPEHTRYRDRPMHSPDPRLDVDYGPGDSAHNHKERSPDKLAESEHYQPDHEHMGEYGGHHLGLHPEYMRSPVHYGTAEPFLPGNQRYGVGTGYAGNSTEHRPHGRHNSMEQERRRFSGEGEGLNSISVDDPHRHYSLGHHGSRHTQRRYSGMSESSTSESPFRDTPKGGPGKGRVSWSSEVTEYPAED
jgi:hypothetical protein